MSHRIRPFFPGFLAIGLAAAACDSQVDPDYQGEPLAQVQGRVSAEVPTPASGMQAVVLWMRAAGRSIEAFGESASVTFDVAKMKDGGPYKFFCSFPGHLAIMQGSLQVQ